MAKIMTAKYRGTCAACHGPIAPGARIDYRGRGNVRHVNCSNVPDTDDGLTWSSRGQSGRGGYVDSRGVCEDAPCCGCCGTNVYGEYQGNY